MSGYALSLPGLVPGVGPARGVTDLVARAQRGDREAFERLYREEAGRVYAVCLRLAGDAGVAQEYVQDVFIRIWEQLPSFRGEAAFSSWVYRVAVNVVLQGERARGRRERRVRSMGVVPDRGAPPPSTADRLDLERAIAELPDGARRVFVLHDVEGFSHVEISGMVGIAPGTSKAHLHRARRLLRGALR